MHLHPPLHICIIKIFDRLNILLQTEFQEKIVGCVVLTKYNNKTYKITDVDFHQSPESRFPKKTKDGTVQISYLEYYQQVGTFLISPV